MTYINWHVVRVHVAVEFFGEVGDCLCSFDVAGRMRVASAYLAEMGWLGGRHGRALARRSNNERTIPLFRRRISGC